MRLCTSEHFFKCFLLLLREPCLHGCCVLLPGLFLLSGPAGFVPMSCSSSSAKPAIGNFLALTTVLYHADVRGRQKFSTLLYPRGFLYP